MTIIIIQQAYTSYSHYCYRYTKCMWFTLVFSLSSLAPVSVCCLILNSINYCSV